MQQKKSVKMTPTGWSKAEGEYKMGPANKRKKTTKRKRKTGEKDKKKKRKHTHKGRQWCLVALARQRESRKEDGAPVSVPGE